MTEAAIARARWSRGRRLSSFLTSLVFVSLWWPVPAPVPCTTALKIAVEVGGEIRDLGVTEEVESGDVQERACETVNTGYQGYLVIGCEEGTLNVTTDDCIPKDCTTSDAVSITLGSVTDSVHPTKYLYHLYNETRLCRIVNPLYRGTMTLYCNYGVLTMDTSVCITQWDEMDEPPWLARSRHAVVGLDGGAFLVVGGLASTGPLREVWQWTPNWGTTNGTWEQPWSRPTPPWTGRYGVALAHNWIGDYEQVILTGGNDGRNRADVWRWIRDGSESVLPLSNGQPTGTQEEDCTETRTSLVCNADTGVSGRRWHLDYDQWPSTEVLITFTFSWEVGTNGTAMVAIVIDDCRQVFQVVGGNWSTYGCSGTDPPWVESHDVINLGNGFETSNGATYQLRLEVNRTNGQVIASLNGTTLPVRSSSGDITSEDGVSVSTPACSAASVPASEADVCTAASADAANRTMELQVVEAAAWPSSTLEIHTIDLIIPSGSWQELSDEAPWPARTSHSLVALPDGDLLLLGGLGDEGLLNDVWRWSPWQCTLFEDMAPAVASRYELECTFDCQPSPLYGQWRQLANAPWAARQELAAVWTSAGLLVVAGRTANGFESDVWRWTTGGELCSFEWQGVWTLVTAVAGWAPRHGHSLVGFTLPGQKYPATVLMIGGFGGDPERDHVEEETLENPITSRSDMWCGNEELGNFSNWTQFAPYGPFSDRTQAAAVAAPSLGTFSLVFFGGYDSNSRFVGDFWRWTGDNATAACKTDYVA